MRSSADLDSRKAHPSRYSAPDLDSRKAHSSLVPLFCPVRSQAIALSAKSAGDAGVDRHRPGDSPAAKSQGRIGCPSAVVRLPPWRGSLGRDAGGLGWGWTTRYARPVARASRPRQRHAAGTIRSRCVLFSPRVPLFCLGPAILSQGRFAGGVIPTPPHSPGGIGTGALASPCACEFGPVRMPNELLRFAVQLVVGLLERLRHPSLRRSGI